MFWLLRLASGGMAAPAHTVSVSAADTPRGDWSRLFVMNAPAASASAPAAQDPAAAARFKLVGVAAPRWAVIGVDGKPARSVAVGAVVDGNWVLQSVQAKEVAIGPRGEAAVVTLTLAGLPPAATGTLPPATPAFGAAVPMPPAVPTSPMLPGLGPGRPSPVSVTGALPPVADAMAPSAVLPPPKPVTNTEPPADSNTAEPTPASPVLTR
jgi:general secretion pathway protein C